MSDPELCLVWHDRKSETVFLLVQPDRTTLPAKIGLDREGVAKLIDSLQEHLAALEAKL